MSPPCVSLPYHWLQFLWAVWVLFCSDYLSGDSLFPWFLLEGSRYAKQEMHKWARASVDQIFHSLTLHWSWCLCLGGTFSSQLLTSFWPSSSTICSFWLQTGMAPITHYLWQAFATCFTHTSFHLSSEPMAKPSDQLQPLPGALLETWTHPLTSAKPTESAALGTEPDRGWQSIHWVTNRARNKWYLRKYLRNWGFVLLTLAQKRTLLSDRTDIWTQDHLTQIIVI